MISNARLGGLVLALMLGVCAWVFHSSPEAGNKSVFLRIRSAYLFSKPDTKQTTDNVVSLGESMEILETKGAWVRVKTQPPKNSKQKEGWLPIAWTIEQAPAVQVKGGDNPVATQAMQTKIITFTASRGGKEEHLRMFWARQSTPVDTESFLKDGKLGFNREADAFPLEGAAK